MLKYIFKNLDGFLESLRSKINCVVNKIGLKNANANSKKQTPSEILQSEIAKQEHILSQKESIHAKHEIRRKVLYLRLQLRVLEKKNRYIIRAWDMLRDEVEESAYEALEYLKRIPNSVSDEIFIDTQLYKALIFELLEDFEGASAAYKEALKKDKTSQTLIAYREFVVRSREFVSWHTAKKESLGSSIYNMHQTIALEDMPAAAQRLLAIAKYYTKSPKSRSLGRSYYKEALRMYKKLFEHDREQYSCAYIEALLDGVEIFMMPLFFLKEAQELLSSRECTQTRIYLLERIRELKQKDFIKRGLSFFNE